MAIPELSRRVFLRRSLRLAGALAVLPVAPGCAPGHEASAPDDLSVVSPGEWVLLDVVTDAFVPAGGAFPTGARDVELARRIDAFLTGEDPEVVRGLASALRLVEWGSPLLAGRLGRFSRLDLEGRTACLAALAGSRLELPRQVFGALKELSLFVFYAADASWPATGYDGPWVERAG